MNIGEAIEILQTLNDRQKGIWFVGESEATQLGIEAMKRIEQQRQDGYYIPNKSLPGETEGVSDGH